MTSRDVGAQPERTRFAWRRMSLSATGVVLLAVRGLIVDGVTRIEALALALLALTWITILADGHRRVKRLAAARPAALRTRQAVLTATAVIALVVLSLVTLW